MTSRRRHALLLALGASLLGAVRAVSGQGVPVSAPRDDVGLAQVLRRRVSGELLLTGEGYANVGNPARRPGSSWRAQLSPRVDLGMGVVLGTDILLSSEGSEFRQNINQFGLRPQWSWGTLYLGDFTNPITPYTTQGIRVRGAGLDVRGSGWRAGIQGGRTQRAVSRPGESLTFARSMIAGTAQLGTPDERGVQVTVLHARDNPNSVERSLLIADSLALDSLVADTLLDPFRPRPGASTRPQENLVASIAAGLPLFGRALRLRGEFASALLTRDLTRPRIAEGSGGAAEWLDPLFPLRLSTSGDLAWNADAQLALGATQWRAQVERVGAGYTSLGLGYLINDRQGVTFGGSAPLFGGALALQGQVQRQSDNLLGQKEFTTRRDNATGSALWRVSSAVQTTLTAFANLVGNDAASDTARLDVRTWSVTSSTSATARVRDRPVTTSLTYAVQSTVDAAPRRSSPDVQVRNLSLAVNVALSRAWALAPSLSWASTGTAGLPDQRNAFVGFRANGRLWRDALRTSASLSRTFTAGRQVLGARASANWALPGEVQAQLQYRWNRYAAFGTRPGFRESFLTLTMSRPF